MRSHRSIFTRLKQLVHRKSSTPSESTEATRRRRLAERYLEGEGIEIGALNRPLPTPPGARVRYVDRMDAQGLSEHYPEIPQATMVPIHVIDDGERLKTFADESLDFMIANHFLEHCEDPIGAVATFLRVLRRGGVVYLAVPDKRYTFDRPREETTFDHVLADWREGPERSRRKHYEEWIRIIHEVKDDAWAENRIRHYMNMRYSIHFHAWTRGGLEVFFDRLRRELNFPMRIECIQPNGEECILILRKA